MPVDPKAPAETVDRLRRETTFPRPEDVRLAIAAKDEEIARLRVDLYSERTRAANAEQALSGTRELLRAAESEVTRLKERVEELEARYDDEEHRSDYYRGRAEAAESEVTRLKAELIDARNLIDTGHADVAAEKLRAAIRSEASKLPAAGETGWRPTHQHYKGGLYRVIARGKIEADLTPCVVYDDRFGEVWVRPQTNFDGVVDENGYIPRFAPLPAPPQSAAE